MSALLKNIHEISSAEVSSLIKKHHFSLLSSFYEIQSAFLTEIYKRYGSIESANIILCFARNMHLSIIRQREKKLNFDISLNNFFTNMSTISKPCEKIIDIVKITGIPKETVRRKIKKLYNEGYLVWCEDNKKYTWDIPLKTIEAYFSIISDEIINLSRFILKFTTPFKIKLNSKDLEKEIKLQFSFYWYHYLSSQLLWLRRWQCELQDNDLLLIILQTVVPSMNFISQTKIPIGKDNEINSENLFKIVGRVDDSKYKINGAISATSISDITHIPRATCIRKLEKLVNLGFLLREKNTKRYYINQNMEDRTKNIMTRENVQFTIQTFSQFISLIINSLLYNNKKKKN